MDRYRYRRRFVNVLPSTPFILVFILFSSHSLSSKSVLYIVEWKSNPRSVPEKKPSITYCRLVDWISACSPSTNIPSDLFFQRFQYPGQTSVAHSPYRQSLQVEAESRAAAGVPLKFHIPDGTDGDQWTTHEESNGLSISTPVATTAYKIRIHDEYRTHHSDKINLRVRRHHITSCMDRAHSCRAWHPSCSRR